MAYAFVRNLRTSTGANLKDFAQIQSAERHAKREDLTGKTRQRPDGDHRQNYFWSRAGEGLYHGGADYAAIRRTASRFPPGTGFFVFTTHHHRRASRVIGDLAGSFVCTPTNPTMTPTITTNEPKQITLYYHEGSSDKVYHVSLERNGSPERFLVRFAFGRRGCVRCALGGSAWVRYPSDRSGGVPERPNGTHC